MNEIRVGVLGATSPIAEYLLPLLGEKLWHVVAFSRSAARSADISIEWRQLDSCATTCAANTRQQEAIERWICLAPIWVLQNYFDLLDACGVRQIVALSSTSRFTKHQSSSIQEQVLARRLSESEDLLINWAETHGVKWVILRPTLVYGRGRDRNVAEVARFIRRFRFFPLLGSARGLRQPVHSEDVAAACVAALERANDGSRDYNLSGGEILQYREMIGRVFIALGREPRFVTVPLHIFQFAINGLRLLPPYRQWSTAMAERMNQDLVFDHSEATRDLNFLPRPFQLKKEDVGL